MLVPVPLGKSRVTGRMRFDRIHAGPDGVSSMRIVFDSGESQETGCDCYGLHAEIDAHDPDRIGMFVVNRGIERPIVRTMRRAGPSFAPVGSSGASEPSPVQLDRRLTIPFEMAGDDRGALTVVIGGTGTASDPEHREYAAGDFARHTLRLECSGADVRVTDLRFQ